MLRKIYGGSNSTPFINFDITDFIIDSEGLVKRTVTEKELVDLIDDAVRFLQKGDREEIRKLVLSKINARITLI